MVRRKQIAALQTLQDFAELLKIIGDLTRLTCHNYGIAEGSDKAILVACEPLSNSTVYSTGSAVRSVLTDTLNLSTFRGKHVHTCIGFVAEDGKEIANSIYTGEVVVSLR